MDINLINSNNVISNATTYNNNTKLSSGIQLDSLQKNAVPPDNLSINSTQVINSNDDIDKNMENNKPSNEEIMQNFKELADSMKEFNNINLQVVFNDKNIEQIDAIKLVDTNTKETIRQIPSEEMLKITKQIREALDNMKGFIINDKV